MNEGAKELLARGSEELGVHLSPAQRGKFHLLAAELKKWGKKINLTAIRDDGEIAVKHFVDSLAVAPLLGKSSTLLDLGSGAGFPAIPLCIVLPGLTVVSVDAVEKKLIFQRHVCRLLALQHFHGIHARGEDLPHTYRGYFDCIVSRAFSDLPTFARLSLPLLHEGGLIIAMKGKGGREEADHAKAALGDLGLRVEEVREFSLPVSGDARSLVLMRRHNVAG